MPKIVDHDKRKKQIAEATWRVILERGMEGATVRNIATEAGLSLGALRHYFSTQEDLLVYAMKLVKEKAEDRINHIAMQDLPVKEKILNILLELVPTDAEKMAEMEVWFTFIAHTRHKKEHLDDDGIYKGVQKLIDYLDHVHLLKENIDKELETEKLYALLDGLALHAMFDADRVNKERITKILVHHLNSICTEE
ncbi:TetR/AcrR family transcriptional regulator [Priestia megaterium]|nr:TetR/AcrR family transcriptional regulator [Priestia megaterium]